LLGDAVECIFAAVEHDYCDAAAGNAGGYGGYAADVFGGYGIRLYRDGECDDTGWRVRGFQGDRCEWDGGGCVDGAAL
jgi:hypothetical protein